MGCGITTVKYLLFIFNAVFALCGLAILVAGALTYANVEEAHYFMEHVNNEINFSASPITLIVVGSIIFVIAFFGCCGAIRESHCMIVTFAVLLLALLLIQIAIGIYVFVLINQGDFEEAVANSIKNGFANSNDTDAMREIDNLQSQLECCGVDGPLFWDGKISPPPLSCCKVPRDECQDLRNSDQVFQQGCVERLKELLQNYGILLGALAIAIGVVELIGIVCALCLANSIRNGERRGTV